MVSVGEVKLWKWLGVAGIAGVAATGVILARDERARRAYTPDDVRARLHERAAQVTPEPEPAVAEPGLFSRIGRRLRQTLRS